MPRGRRPEPAVVREQKEPVRSPHRPRPALPEAAAAPGGLVPPKWLKGEAKRIFERRAPVLRAAKLLAEADVDAFARYCKHFERWIGYQKRLDKEGDIYEIKTASGKVRRADPAFTMADRLDRMMLAFEDRFGLNPAERQRIMIARANTGVSGDLFGTPAAPAAPPTKRPDDPAAEATQPAEPSESPVGFLN